MLSHQNVGGFATPSFSCHHPSRQYKRLHRSCSFDFFENVPSLEEQRTFSVAVTSSTEQCSGSLPIMSMEKTNSSVRSKSSKYEASIQRSISLPMNMNEMGGKATIVLTNFNNNKCGTAVMTSNSSSKSIIRKMKSNVVQENKDSSTSRAKSKKVVRIKEPTSSKSGGVVSVRKLLKLMDTQQWKQVERICEDQPEIIKEATVGIFQGEKFKSVPLWFACRHAYKMPVSTIDALVTAYPSAVYKADLKRGLLPIHLACCCDAPLAVVQYLLKAYPQSLYVKDKEGNLPIHYISSMTTKHGKNASKVLSFLVEQDGAICGTANMKEKLPLHLICSRWESTDEMLSLSCIDEVIKSFPDAVVKRDGRNKLPLHIACAMTNPRVDLIELLLKECPETISSHDGNTKQTPLQLVNNNDPVAKLLSEYKKRESKRKNKNVSFFGKLVKKNKNTADISREMKKVNKSREDVEFEKVKHQYVTVYHR